MIVEAHELRQRFAERVAALSGYEEADAPFDPGTAPANVALRSFSVLLPQTLANGTRDRSGGAMEVKTRVIVRCQSAVNLAGPGRIAAMDLEMKAEAGMVRHMMKQGETWMYGLRVAFAGIERVIMLGDEWLQTDVNFDVGHTVQL